MSETAAAGRAGAAALKALLAAYREASKTPGSKKSNLIDALLHTIEHGHWQPGDRLPTERELADALPVSLGTVQGALSRLTDAGVVERKAGVGTHVTNLSAREGDRWYLRFLADENADLLALEILGAGVIETDEPGPWAAFLGNRPSYVRTSRLILVDGRFRVIARVYLDGRRFRPLLDFDLGVIAQLHIRQILHDRFHAPTLARRTRIRFLPIQDNDAAELQVPPGTQCIALDVASYTLGDAPLCFQRFIIPPNDCALDVKRD